MPFIIEKERDPLYKDGLKEGSNETKIAIAKALLQEKVAIEIIMKSTGLSKEEIEKLAENGKSDLST